MRRLNGIEQGEFQKALLDAFPFPQMFELMLWHRLEKNLFLLPISSSPYPICVSQLILLANAEGWHDKLLLKAREANPGNLALMEFAQKFNGTSVTPQLEKQIRKDLGFADVVTWRTQLGKIETVVCRIAVPVGLGTEYGTGFLVADDVVLTNYHVIEKVAKLQVPPEYVSLLFDYKVLSDGAGNQTVNTGAEFKLDDDWLIDSSPYSAVDKEALPKSGTPSGEELDYALLRVAGSPGAMPVGEKAEPGAPARGFITLSAKAPILAADMPMLIMQHPRSQPLKLAYDTNSIRAVNDNRTRVTYNTNTDWGSSGSPCFDKDWNLVALHHSGVPSIHPNSNDDDGVNEGIPIDAIVNKIIANDKQSAIGL